MALELDHAFVAVQPAALDMGALAAAGFEEGPRSRHTGQGTASAGVFFENCYLEFLWLEDPAATESAPIRRTCLRERADPGPHVLPFGFGLRQSAGVSEGIPFSTWDYRPPYLPSGMSIPTGANSENLAEPLLFVLPWKSGPGYACPDHPNGARTVTRVSLTARPLEQVSPEFQAFLSLGLVAVEFADDPLLSVELDHGGSGESLDLRPAVPLVIRW